MARPTNKQQLLDLSDSNYAKLQILIDSLPPEALTGAFPFDDRDRNVRDVLAHLHEWHLMMEEWYRVGMSGEKPVIPGEGYTWKTLPALNKKVWEKYQSIDLHTIREALEDSHQRLTDLINSHADEELFEKKRYPWTGTTSLGAYLISSTSSHYDWALKKLRKYQRSL